MEFFLVVHWKTLLHAEKCGYYGVWTGTCLKGHWILFISWNEQNTHKHTSWILNYFSYSLDLPSGLLWAGYIFLHNEEGLAIWLLFYYSYHLLWLSVWTSYIQRRFKSKFWICVHSDCWQNSSSGFHLIGLWSFLSDKRTCLVSKRTNAKTPDDCFGQKCFKAPT